MHPVATAQLRARALTALLGRSEGDPAAVRALWKGLRADERASGAVAVQFARAFADCGAQDDARRIVEQTLDAGMDDVLHKPMDLEQLVRVIPQHIAGVRSLHRA
jgi:uncharacterized protein HemY